MVNIVIPMAGTGNRFKMAGFRLPKPFLNVNGKMMIERVLQGLHCPCAHYTLILQRKDFEQYVPRIQRLENLYRVAFICVEQMTQGACCTALAAHDIINNSIPVVFADSDNIFHGRTFQNFVQDCLARDLDGSLITFPSRKSYYSYVELDSHGFVTATHEKEPISTRAIAGAYMFARGCDFVTCAIDTLIYGKLSHNEYYMSNVYNVAVNRNFKIGVYDISEHDWSCVGTPELLLKYTRESNNKSSS